MDMSRVDGVKAPQHDGTLRSHVLVLHLCGEARLKPSLDVLLPGLIH
jgi:hypothetical protein